MSSLWASRFWFYLFHRVVLSPQGIEVRWSPYCKSLPAEAIETAFHLEERNRRALLATAPQRMMVWASRSRDWTSSERALGRGLTVRPRLLYARRRSVARNFVPRSLPIGDERLGATSTRSHRKRRKLINFPRGSVSCEALASSRISLPRIFTYWYGTPQVVGLMPLSFIREPDRWPV